MEFNCDHVVKQSVVVGGREGQVYFINRQTPDVLELCMADIKVVLYKCHMFRSGSFQMWSVDHFIKIVRGAC